MAKRTSSHHRGLMGELAMTKLLSGLGMSVHSLTSSDFGLDLHAYLPLNAPFADVEVQRNSDPWEMSSFPVNFQVKTTNPDAQEPNISVETLREWVNSSPKVPVFVLVAHMDDSTSSELPFCYITPAGLKRLLEAGKPVAEKRKLSYRNPEFAFFWDRRAFYAQVWLWTVAPALMSEHADFIALPNTYETGRSVPLADHPLVDFDVRVMNTIAIFAHSYLHRFHPRGKIFANDEVLAVVRELTEAYEGRAHNDGKPVGVWCTNDFAENQITDNVVLNLQSGPPRLSDGAYTVSNDPQQALNDLKRLVGILSLLQPRRSNTRINPNDPANYEGLVPST